MKRPYDSELMTIFKFAARDLEMNRSGVISEQQMKRLRKDRTAFLLLCGACWFAILLLLSGFCNSPLRQGQFHLVVNTALGIGIITAIVVPISLLAVYTRSRRVLAQGRVIIVDGKIEFRKVYTSRNELINSIRIAETEFFDIGTEEILRLRAHYQQGDDYRFYYVFIGYQNIILSVEKIA